MVTPQEKVWAGQKKINRLGSPSERRYGRVKKKMKIKNEKILLKRKY